MKKLICFILASLPIISSLNAQQPQQTRPTVPGQQQSAAQPQQPGQAQQAQQTQRPVDPRRMVPGMAEVMEPVVKIIKPGATNQEAPSDAIVLFNGSDINTEWEDSRGNPTKWIVQDGELLCVKGSGPIKTKRKFGSIQLHIEWKSPSNVIGTSQGRGNSGVFLQNRYEVQILDSYDNLTYRHGQAASIYKQHAPLVNSSRGPGEWQSFDIIYTAPTFNPDSISYFTPPRVTVLHNGVLVLNNVSIIGPTDYVIIPQTNVKFHGPDCIQLQDHGNPVAFRNIWVREL